MANLQQQLAEKLYLGHLQIIVVSDEIAENGLSEINDFLRRDHEVRRTAWMIVNRKDASKVIRTAPPIETVPALYLSDTLDNAVQFGKLPREYIGKFWIDISDKGVNAVLPAVKVIEGDSGVYMVKSQERKPHIEIKMKNGRPSASFTVDVDAIVDEEVITNKLSEEKIRQIEKAVNQKREDLCQELIKKTQQKGSDIWGIGARVRAKYGTYWDQEVKDEETWSEIYKNIDIEVKVNYKIRRTGMEVN